MITSSNVRWNAKNNMKMLNNLKYSNNNVIMNNSDSREEVNEGSSFLKGGAITALWSRIVNYAAIE